MIRKLLLTFVLFVSAAAGFAQTTTITALNTKGSDGNKIGAGTITFRATDLLGNPFFGHQGGLVIPKAVVCLLVNGAITGSQAGGSCSLVDTAATAPAHFCYVATIYDSVGRWTAPPTPCMQPTGSTWSLDSFVPITPTAIVNTGVAGPPGPAGPGGVDGIPEVDTLAGTDLGAKLSACFASLSSTYGGSCDARGLHLWANHRNRAHNLSLQRCRLSPVYNDHHISAAHNSAGHAQRDHSRMRISGRIERQRDGWWNRLGVYRKRRRD